MPMLFVCNKVRFFSRDRAHMKKMINKDVDLSAHPHMLTNADFINCLSEYIST